MDKTQYSVFESRYNPENAREDQEFLKPYVVTAGSKEEVFSIVTLDHYMHRGLHGDYKGSYKEENTVVSVFSDGSSRVGVVEKGALEPVGGLEELVD